MIFLVLLPSRIKSNKMFVANVIGCYEATPNYDKLGYGNNYIFHVAI